MYKNNSNMIKMCHIYIYNIYLFIAGLDEGGFSLSTVAEEETTFLSHKTSEHKSSSTTTLAMAVEEETTPTNSCSTNSCLRAIPERNRDPSHKSCGRPALAVAVSTNRPSSSPSSLVSSASLSSFALAAPGARKQAFKSGMGSECMARE